jgi:ABC-type branched-subunit amino acid transport system ATPase component
MATLEITGLRKKFGGIVALAGVDLTISDHEILGIIDPNRSGKSTLFNVVCGIQKPTAGRVLWDGRDITGRSPYEIARLGIGHTFQQAMAFPSLSVRENVQIALEHGCASHDRTHFRWASPDEILDFVGLNDLAKETANAMPFGNLRQLGIAIAVGGDPAQLLPDEPAAGLNETEAANLVQLIRRVHQMGVGVRIVDHHVDLIAELCERLAVLHFGNKIAEGPTKQVLQDARVVEIYLGAINDATRSQRRLDGVRSDRR